MQKILFLDRDGTLILEPEGYQVDTLEKIAFYPRVFQYLARIVEELDYQLVMITNQDGLGTDSFPESTFWPAHNKIMEAFSNEGIQFKEVLIDKTFAHDNAPTRKPRTGLVDHYMKGNFDLENSFVIGDRLTDMELAKNLNAKGIWLNNDPELGAEETASKHEELFENTIMHTTQSWESIYRYLKSKPDRRATISRKTKETQVLVKLDLDGQGHYDNQTGIGFFDHMLDQLAKHSGCNLYVRVNGDLHIDEHHTIEDTALALGAAFREALGNKVGIQRYGFAILPMDEALARVALDFSGRPWLVWDASLRREKVGQFPTEMFSHFFKSFSDMAMCNLNVQASGQNDHHIIEITFKALARAIRQAVRIDTDYQSLPSTKGVL